MTNTNYLNGIRGLCCLWVLIAHCGIWGGWYLPLLPNAKIAVDIFMILSGYLMVMLYGGKKLNIKQFYWRRFLRIAPLYYLAVFASFALGNNYREAIAFLQTVHAPQWQGGGIYNPWLVPRNWQSLIAHLTFAFGLIPKYVMSLGLPDWSIGSEIQFYLLFPFLLIWLRRSRYWLAISLAVFTCLLWQVRDIIFPTEPSLFFFKAPQYLIGMLLAEGLYCNQKQRVKVWAIALVLAAIQNQYHQEATYLILTTIALISFGLWEDQRAIANKFLGNKLMGFLADTSYGVYLFHGFFICFIGRYLFDSDWFMLLASPLKVGILLLAVILCVYPLAWGLYRAIELPFIRFGKQQSKLSIKAQISIIP